MKLSLMERVRPVLRLLVTLVIVVGGVMAGRYLWNHYLLAPWTRDGRVRADVVQSRPTCRAW